MDREARVVINGVELSDAQSIALRVSVSRFLMDLVNEGTREALGPIAALYEARLREIERLIFGER